MKRGHAAAVAALALSVAAHGAAAQDRDFTIASWGGSYQEGQRDVYFAPYGEDKGIQVLEDVYLGGWAQFKAMQDTGQIPWDVVQVESAEVARGCEEGLFEELDWGRLGGQDQFVQGATSDCGVGVVLVAEVIAYNASLFPDEKPATLDDYFDLEKFPGPRGMRDEPKYNLVRALLADGVPAGDVHELLSTDEGLDRAFAKLDTIKDAIQFWSAGAQAPERLASGDTAISTAYNARVTNAQREGAADLVIAWDQPVLYLDQWVVLADSPNKELAYGFLEYYADADRQVEWSRDKLPYGPSLKAAAGAMPASLAAELPVGPNISNAFMTGTPEDLEFWLDNLDRITERWNAWKIRN
jgi:putative spermidine/putrescine transport system substrate-binding protein